MRLTMAALLFLTAASVAPSQEKYKDVTLTPEERAADLVSRMTLEEKVSQMQNSAAAIPRLDIPAYDWWNEALHGVARAGVATVFPQAIGLAATWDQALEHQLADVVSTEARAKYNDALAHDNHGRYYGLTFWSPNINIFRDPRWGRGQETYGEDPYLTSRMAVQFIKGMQGDDPHYFKTIATAKHYAVHSGPELLRHGFNTQVSDDDLNNTYLYAFRQTVEQAKVASIMCVYNAIDGVPGCANDTLLEKDLRSAWQFKGYVVSDCGAVDDIYTGHHYTKTLAEAAVAAVKAGTDLECGKSYSQLTAAVKGGLISEGEITRSVTRLFTARMRLGMFDPPERVPFSKIGLDVVGSPEHQAVSLQAAREAIVLLKNDRGFLPLEKAPQRIAVVGPAADDPDAMLGNYNGIPTHVVTPLLGLEKEFGSSSTVQFSLGSSYVEGWSALVPQNVLTPENDESAHGLHADYFTSEDFSGTAALTRVEPRVSFTWEMQDPAVVGALSRDHFCVRWTGYLRPKASGEYRVGFIRPECHSCGRIDSARLYIDGQLITEDAEKAGEQTFPKTNPFQLTAGKAYQIRVEYKQHGGAGGLQLVWTPPSQSALQEAVDLVKSSDVAIACVGLNSRLEGEESPLKVPGFVGGDRTDIRLPESQRALLEALFRTGKPVVVVLVNGSALAVGNVQQSAKAILETWYGGQEAGTALAETLAGKNNPGGRLPVTFYASVDQLPAYTDYSMKNRTYRFFTGKPGYPFGFGLSYSKFAYSAAKLTAAEGGATQLTAQVQNKSTRDGDEVVQVYLTRRDGSRPELRGFERLHLKAGESRAVQFTLDSAELKDHVVRIGQPSVLTVRP